MQCYLFSPIVLTLQIDRFKSEKINLISLADYNILVEIVKEQKIISHDEIEKLQRWREDPEDWM